MVIIIVRLIQEDHCKFCNQVLGRL